MDCAIDGFVLETLEAEDSLVLQEGGILVGVEDDTENGILRLFLNGEPLPGGWLEEDTSYYDVPNVELEAGDTLTWEPASAGGGVNLIWKMPESQMRLDCAPKGEVYGAGTPAELR